MSRVPSGVVTYPWLYVLRLKDGGIKFGVTSNPKKRFAVIEKQTPIVWAHLFGRARRDGAVCMAERACIRAAHQVGGVMRQFDGAIALPYRKFSRETFDSIEYTRAIQIGRMAMAEFKSQQGVAVKNLMLPMNAGGDRSTVEFVSRIHGALTTSEAAA